MIESERVKCFYCAEEILKEAKKCKHCGNWTKPEYQKLSEVTNTLKDSEKQNTKLPNNHEKIEDKITKKPLGCLYVSLLLIISCISGIVLFTIITKSTNQSPSNNNVSHKYENDHSFTTQANWLASYSKENLHKGVEMQVNNDDNALNKFISSGEVFILPAGKKAFIVEAPTLGLVKIRISGDTKEIWTEIESIK